MIQNHQQYQRQFQQFNGTGQQQFGNSGGMQQYNGVQQQFGNGEMQPMNGIGVLQFGNGGGMQHMIGGGVQQQASGGVQQQIANGGMIHYNGVQLLTEECNK